MTLTPQQMWLELASERRSEGTPGAAQRGALFEMVERALAAWQADREALEAVTIKKQVAEFALGFPILAPHIKRHETLHAENKELRALLRRARSYGGHRLTCAIGKMEIAPAPWPDTGGWKSAGLPCDCGWSSVLAELDAAQGETT